MCKSVISIYIYDIKWNVHGMEVNTPLKIDSPQYLHNTYTIPTQYLYKMPEENTTYEFPSKIFIYFIISYWSYLEQWFINI